MRAFWLCVVWLVVLAAASAGPKVEKLALTLADLDGALHRPLEAGDKRAAVLFFLWHDCPISNTYAPEINRICAAYTNFAFYLVQVDPDLTKEAAQRHAKDFDLRAPVLLDPQHRLVNAVQATVTPEAVVIAGNGAVVYRGRIDDLYAGLGKKRPQATRHDLRDALDALAAGKQVARSQAKAVGCLIQTNDK